MAEAVQKKENDKKGPGAVAKVGRFFRDLRGESKKIVWPSKKQIINNTIVVLVVVAVFALFIGVFDYLLGLLLNFRNFFNTPVG